MLVGPLVVMLLQQSLRRGTLAALAAALGIWLSDVLLIMVTYYGMRELEIVRSYAYFNEAVGTVGGVILVATAAIMWFREPPNLEAERGFSDKRGLFSAFVQGFAINTFNPFTIGFWPFFAASEIHGRGVEPSGAIIIYVGLMLVLILSDVIKILGARKLREFLTPRVMQRVQRLGAVALALFGVALVVRVWW